MWGAPMRPDADQRHIKRGSVPASQVKRKHTDLDTAQHEQRMEEYMTDMVLTHIAGVRR